MDGCYGSGPARSGSWQKASGATEGATRLGQSAAPGASRGKGKRVQPLIYSFTME